MDIARGNITQLNVYNITKFATEHTTFIQDGKAILNIYKYIYLYANIFYLFILDNLRQITTLIKMLPSRGLKRSHACIVQHADDWERAVIEQQLHPLIKWMHV